MIDNQIQKITRKNGENGKTKRNKTKKKERKRKNLNQIECGRFFLPYFQYPMPFVCLHSFRDVPPLRIVYSKLYTMWYPIRKADRSLSDMQNAIINREKKVQSKQVKQIYSDNSVCGLVCTGRQTMAKLFIVLFIKSIIFIHCTNNFGNVATHHSWYSIVRTCCSCGREDHLS